jgi:hypothetical protein
MKKYINQLCEWQLAQLSASKRYEYYEIAIGIFGMLALALLCSFITTLPTIVYILLWYKSGTLLIFGIAYMLKPKEKKDSTLQSLAISLHLIDVIVVALFLRK